MPKLMDAETQSQVIAAGGSRFTFSHVRPERLGATEYTLVTVVVDVTGSVQGFETLLLDMLKATVESCRQSQRADNLLVRVLTFNTKVDEMHGFRMLGDIDLNDYKPFQPYGSTALFDATINAVGATVAYAATLTQQGFMVNGITFVITDGCDNVSQATAQHVGQEVQKSRQAETMESLLTLLIGVNTQDQQVAKQLGLFRRQANLDGFIDAGVATAHKIAQVAKFISDSIGSQSQMLGTGGPSQVLPFNP